MDTLPLHSLPGIGSLLLVVVATLAVAGTALLLGLALAAFVCRRSRSYLFVVAAFGALFARSVVVGVALFGGLSPPVHHLFEHGLDVVLVALVVAAVYDARGSPQEVRVS